MFHPPTAAASYGSFGSATVAGAGPVTVASGSSVVSPLREYYYYPLIALTGLGALLLLIAGTARRLAPLWPDVFVPVIRRSDGFSLFGVSLVTSGVLGWAIASAG